MKFLTFIISVLLLISCAESGHKQIFVKSRIRVLTTNSINYVKIPVDDLDLYRVNDTVWVNLITHRMDDTSDYPELSVIEKIPTKQTIK